MLIHLPTHVSVHMSVHMSAHMSVHMPVHTSVHMSVQMSVHMSLHTHKLNIEDEVGIWWDNMVRSAEPIFGTIFLEPHFWSPCFMVFSIWHKTLDGAETSSTCAWTRVRELDIDINSRKCSARSKFGKFEKMKE